MEQTNEIINIPIPSNFLFTFLAIGFHPNAHTMADASPGHSGVVQTGGRQQSHSFPSVDLLRKANPPQGFLLLTHSPQL